MKKRYIALSVVGVLAAGAGTAAYVISPTIHEGQTGESPELGRPGDYTLGTFERDFTLPDRLYIDGTGALTDNLKSADRTLSVRFWYPATQPAQGEPVSYSTDVEFTGRAPVPITSQGIAFADAQPLADQTFPLVIMSHGYRGWNTHFSRLAEHITSRGYVVASINHGDLPVEGMADFALSFGNVLVDRTLDQRQILASIVTAANAGDDARLSLIDSEAIGLIGYSMGGYGALATAGAAYDFSKDPMANIPETAQEALRAATAEPAPIKALVAFAPWGGQPDNRVWNPETLAAIQVPTLIISGDHDDVVNYDEGIRWIFDNLTGTDRNLLVYREARHNIVGNDFRVEGDTDFQVIEFLNEPVWRTDRINAINQHFVTAFLDLNLKGEKDKAAYLNVPVTDANDSNWEVSFGEQLNGKLAGPDEADHWRGFQRRWALGLEMHAAEKLNNSTESQ